MLTLRPPVHRPVRAPLASAVADALAASGDLDSTTRRAFMERAIDVALGIESAQPVPATMVGLVDTIARHAYKVGDDDVASLLRTGHTQDAVFEALVSTAMGAGLARLACGLAALEGATLEGAAEPGVGQESGAAGDGPQGGRA